MHARPKSPNRMATWPGYKIAARPHCRHLSERAELRRKERRRRGKKRGEEEEKWFFRAVDDNDGKFVLVFCKSIFFKYCRLAINAMYILNSTY